MTNRVLARESFPEGLLALDLNDKRFVYELSVPTCSYRMGVELMGYGVLLLDSGKRTRSFESHFHPRHSSDENGSSGYSFHAPAIPCLVHLRCLRGVRGSQLDRQLSVSATDIAAPVDLSLTSRINLRCSFVTINLHRVVPSRLNVRARFLFSLDRCPRSTSLRTRASGVTLFLTRCKVGGMSFSVF